MPSEAQQSKLQQPWKQYHASLNPWSRKDIQEGNVVLVNADSGHGTIFIDQKKVDLKVNKEIPKISRAVDRHLDSDTEKQSKD